MPYANITKDTKLIVIRDWTTPYNSNMKGNQASAEYWASKLGKDPDIFVHDFNLGLLSDWFKLT